jgi:Type II secretion system (T2SS), protein E, N-terminal domain
MDRFGYGICPGWYVVESGVFVQPYYLIGQWRLASDRRLRAFVNSAHGTLHLARVSDNESDLTPEEISDCYKRIFPDLLRRLQHFSLEVPGLLRQAPFTSSSAAQTPSDHDHEAADGSGEQTRRLGELLMRDGLITDTQLEGALRLQAASPSYVPIGHILVAHKLISRKTLTMTLRRYRKSARLGEVLLKAGHITAEQLEEGLELQRGTPLRLGQMLVRLGWVRETTMRDALCTQLQVNFVDIDAIDIDPALAQLIPANLARQHRVVPLLRVDDVVVLAMDNPAQVDTIAGLESFAGLEIEAVTSVPQKLRAAMERLYTPAEAPRIGPSDGSVIIGPIRDHAVAELLMRAARRVPASRHA